MPKRDIYKLSESKRPRALFRKPRRRLLTSPWLWLVLVIVITAAVLHYLGLIDISMP